MVVYIITTGLQNVRVGNAAKFKAILNRERYKHNNIAWMTWATPHLNHMPVAILTMYSPHVVERVLRYVTLTAGHWGSFITVKILMLQTINLSKPTGYVMQQQFNIQQLYALPTLFMCFVFIWEQTATCATYTTNWLVFITQMKSVYSAVRTGSLNKAVCASSVEG